MTKDILKNYRWLKLEEYQIQEQIEEWETKAVSAGGTLDGLPRGSHMSNPTAMFAIKLSELRNTLKRKQTEVATELKRIEEAIDELRPVYRFIMREYYINNKKWEQIAVDRNYSIQHVWRLHGEALKTIKLER